jgi:hypothetical protein
LWEEQANDAIHAEAIEKCPERRKQSQVRSVLNLLDQLNKEGRKR